MNTKTLSESKLLDAIEDVRNLGYYEEPFRIGKCQGYLSNLMPEDISTVLENATAEVDQSKNPLLFNNALHYGTLSRAIVEINGVDLRGVEYIETEMPDPDHKGKRKKTLVERHRYIQEKILSTWRKEPIELLYMKQLEVSERAEKECNQHIRIDLSDESPEQKYRRILTELKEQELNLPLSLSQKILREAGYASISTQEEAEDVLVGYNETDDSSNDPESIEPSPEDIQIPMVVMEPPKEEPSMLAGSRDLEPNPIPVLNRTPITRAPTTKSVPVESPPIPQPPAPAPSRNAPRDLTAAKDAGIFDSPPKGGMSPRFRPSR